MKPRDAASTRHETIGCDGGHRQPARAASKAGVERCIEQSNAFCQGAIGSAIKREQNPLWVDAPSPTGEWTAATRERVLALLAAQIPLIPTWRWFQ
jgi:hypothetical protein